MTTKSTGKVEVICSLIPGVDETVMLGHLKARSDHDTPFELYCRYLNLPREQRADPSNLTVDFQGNELWRALQMPHGYSESPWN
jgi:hypothetical protein